MHPTNQRHHPQTPTLTSTWPHCAQSPPPVAHLPVAVTAAAAAAARALQAAAARALQRFWVSPRRQPAAAHEPARRPSASSAVYRARAWRVAMRVRLLPRLSMAAVRLAPAPEPQPLQTPAALAAAVGSAPDAPRPHHAVTASGRCRARRDDVRLRALRDELHLHDDRHAMTAQPRQMTDKGAH